MQKCNSVLTFKIYIMKNPYYKVKLDNGKILLFQESQPQSTLTIDDYFTIDFEFHVNTKTHNLVLLREFHINDPDHLVRATEQALFNLLVSFAYFDLCFEDGYPCLTKTITA